MLFGSRFGRYLFRFTVTIFIITIIIFITSSSSSHHHRHHHHHHHQFLTPSNRWLALMNFLSKTNHKNGFIRWRLLFPLSTVTFTISRDMVDKMDLNYPAGSLIQLTGSQFFGTFIYRREFGCLSTSDGNFFYFLTCWSLLGDIEGGGDIHDVQLIHMSPTRRDRCRL